MAADAARFGIVDMGSNAIRMMVVEASNTAQPTTLENHRLPLRLGRDVFLTGLIPEPTIGEVVDAFRRFRATCERYAVRHVRAIGTAAVREARNRDLLIDRIRDATGIEVEVISGTQEAYLLVKATQTKVDLAQGRSLLTDLGGGSVEVVLIENGQVLAADSYRLGALRLLRALQDAGSGTGFVELLHRHLRGLERRIAERLGNARIDRLVATGGNIESLADLIRGPGPERKNGEVEHVDLADLEREANDLAQLTYAERITRKGLKPDRADTILPAAVVYARLARIAGVDRLLVPRVGIKDGLVQEIVTGHLAAFSAADHEDVVLSSCRALGRKYHYEAEHAETVLSLARQLFDQTQALHGLDQRARVLLEASALLHDIGVVVNNSGHHKHSHYLIRGSEIVGLTEEERDLVALVARYHRRAPPGREQTDYAALKRKDRLLVERLAALLRISDALDRQHSGLLRSVEVVVCSDHVELRTSLLPGQSSPLILEQRALEDKGGLFADLFGRPIRLVTP